MTTLRKTLDTKVTCLSPNQQKFFNRIFPDLTKLKPSDVNSAIRLCDRAIVDNEQNKQKLSELFNLYPNKVKEAESSLGQKETHQVIDAELFKSYTSILTKVEVIVPIKKCITEGLSVTPKDKQLNKPYFDFNSFDSEEEAKEYFKDEGSSLFEVGQGLYQNEAETFCYIKDVFFKVNLEAEVWGAKQDRGYKLYHVERITKVEFAHINEKVVVDVRKKEIDTKLKAAMITMENLMKQSLELEKY